jgi:DNA-binding MarR family transcriptional regulator
MTDQSTIDAPKDGTKEARLVKALGGKGQTLTQLSHLLSWQPHTVRAALTRLRKRGYVIDRTEKTETSAARFKLRGDKA